MGRFKGSRTVRNIFSIRNWFFFMFQTLIFTFLTPNYCVQNTWESLNLIYYVQGDGRVVRWCWINFQCLGVLLIWISVWQWPTALAVGAGGGCLDIFTLVYHFSFLSPSLWETARYRLKYCLKRALSPKHPTNQPTNHTMSQITARWMGEMMLFLPLFFKATSLV